MSLILDALKKAEQDRHAGQAPVLDEMLVRPTRLAARRPHHQQQDMLLVAAITTAVLFAGAGIVYWLWPSAAPAPISQPAMHAPVIEPAPVEVSTPAPALRVDPERLQAPITDVPEDQLDIADTGASEATTMDDLEGDSTLSARRKPQVSNVPAESAPQPVPPVEPAVPSARPLKQMPPSFRSEFPKLVVEVHVYDDNPLRRFILVNSKKYRETDTLLEGPRVVEIAPDGVVVDYRGSQVLLELPH